MAIRDSFTETIADGDQLNDGYFNGLISTVKTAAHDIQTWKLLGSDTLGATGSSLSVSGLTTSSYDVIRVLVFPDYVTGASNLDLTFNSDTGTNYTEIDGTGTETSGQTALTFGRTQSDRKVYYDITVTNSNSTGKHMFNPFGVLSDSSVAATAGIWGESSNYISTVTITSVTASRLASGSKMYVYGLIINTDIS